MTGVQTCALPISGFDGLFYGNPNQLLIQAGAVAISILFSFGMTFVLTKVVSLFTPLRVSENEEEVGLDISEHGERAFA